jgi:hypothetical protein
MGIAVAAGSVHFRHYVAAALGVMATLGAVAGAFTFIY